MTIRTMLLAAAALTAIGSAAQAGHGSDGELRILMWQAPTTVNVYLSSGTQDFQSLTNVADWSRAQ